MRLHRLALFSAVALVGCESLRTASEPAHPSVPAAIGAPLSNVTLLRPVSASSPALTVPTAEISAAKAEVTERVISSEAAEPDSLTLAADCLQRGDRANAAVHLEVYVCRHPEQIMFRAQLAELLIRIGRDDAAKIHYEKFVADAQSATGPARNNLVNAHTRLMEIGQRSDDPFEELLHRGIGLLLLVKDHEKTADPDAGFSEEMLCKAIKALNEAKGMKPTDRRVRVYLAEALERSGNRHAAEAERAATRNQFAPGGLTPTEQKHVLLLP